MAETILKSILQELTENEKRVSQDEMEICRRDPES